MWPLHRYNRHDLPVGLESRSDPGMGGAGAGGEVGVAYRFNTPVSYFYGFSSRFPEEPLLVSLELLVK